MHPVSHQACQIYMEEEHQYRMIIFYNTWQYSSQPYFQYEILPLLLMTFNQLSHQVLME